MSGRIKKYREENHITQQKLADKLYVSKAISKWKNDKNLPDVSLYPTIANLLNVTVDELMENEVKKNKFTSIKKIIIICSIIISLFFVIIGLIIINPCKLMKEK